MVREAARPQGGLVTITEPRLIYVSGRIKDYEDHPKHG